jgi:hypothetical protein
MSHNIFRKLIIIVAVLTALVIPAQRIGAQAQTASSEKSSALFCDTPPLAGMPSPLLPTTLQAEIHAPGNAIATAFGGSVAASADGNTLLVGAAREDSNGIADSGAAYVFVRSGITWTLQARLTASNESRNNFFGQVALSADGNTALIGTPDSDEDGLTDTGTAYFFTRTGTTWTQQAKVVASDKAAEDLFGSEVELSADGSIAFIAALSESDGATVKNGAVYAFVRSGAGWVEQAKLLADDKADQDNFGSSVALSANADIVLIGAYKKSDAPTTQNGAAYVFARSGATWTQQVKLLAETRDTQDYFGISVGLSADGNTALIGAYGMGASGSALIFTRTGTTWTQQSRLDGSAVSSAIAGFGWEAALSGDGNTALIGAPSTGDGCISYGAAIVYTRTGSTWAFQTALGNDRFSYESDAGRAVALSADGESAFVGAPYQNYYGSVFVFTPPENAPTPTPTATATTTTATATTTPVPPRTDTIGVYKDGVFYLRNSNTFGNADITAVFGGDPSDVPVAGDWNGDGADTIGVYRGSTGFFLLSDSNTTPAVNYSALFGNPGDVPFAGKWTNDMTGSGIGVYRNSNGIVYQRKSLTSGTDDYFAIFGNPDDQAIAGDWDGNGFDSIGIYRSANQTWYLANNSTPNGITFSDLSFEWSIGASMPVVGDWNGDGSSTTGYLAQSGGFVLNANHGNIGSFALFAFGPDGSKPIAGKWTVGSRPAVAGVVAPISAGGTTNQGGDAD